MTTATTLARALGVFSLGLGVTQLLAPGRFASSIGIHPDRRRTLATAMVGARELGVGGALLADPRAVKWPWMRVAGDVMDAGLLARALVARDVHRGRAALALLSVAGIGALDVVAGMAMLEEQGPQGTATVTPDGKRQVRRALTVRASRQQAYDLWRDFSRLPQFMNHLESVEVTDDGRRSHWRAKAPAGRTVEWDAEVIEDRPGEIIAWRAVPGSSIQNAGRVRFVDAPGDRGTEVHVEMEYAAPLGTVGVVVARLMGQEPAQQVSDDLRRFKEILETGRIAWSDATIGDRKLRQRPAQPPDQPVREPVASAA